MVQLVEQESMTEHGILMIARFLWCLPTLCPTLKQCLVSLNQQVNKQMTRVDLYFAIIVYVFLSLTKTIKYCFNV